MTKKQFYFFLFLIFLIISVFLLIVFFEVQESRPANTLNLGQAGEEVSFSDLNSTIYFCPENYCKQEIINLINNSKQTIDCAVYDITSKEISTALINKKLEGVNIRIITDLGRSSTKTSQIGSLKFGGVDVLLSPVENSYMHNKFCVFDGNVVFIGSTNFTDNSFESYNNILVFNNKELSNLLTYKLDSFYSGQFSKDSSFFGKDFGALEIYFCPTDDCIKEVQEELDLATESIECMMYSFTLTEFADSIIRTKGSGVETKIILENQQVTQYSEYQRLKSEGIDIILDNQKELLHNKYCVIDDKTVLTGSMNFSFNGTNNNDEIVVIIHSSEIARNYKENFYSYWNVWKNLAN